MLIKVAEGLEEGSEINQMIETLKKHERFIELEYKVRREFASGESRYSGEIIQSSIEE